MAVPGAEMGTQKWRGRGGSPCSPVSVASWEPPEEESYQLGPMELSVWPTQVHQEQERSTSYPSLLSHLTSMYLSTPPLVLPVAKRQGTSPALRSFHPLASPLPCDFHLLNLRMLPAEDTLPATDSALILHRKGFDCGLEAKNLGFNCTTSQGKLALGSLFHGLDVTFLQPTSLTLLYPLASPSNSTDISLEPMEISTFRLRLG